MYRVFVMSLNGVIGQTVFGKFLVGLYTKASSRGAPIILYKIDSL